MDIKINLVGDAGYLANEETKKKLSEKGVTLITPYRKNQNKHPNKNKDDRKKKASFLPKLKKRSGSTILLKEGVKENLDQ